jgi:hypothetical protein
LITMEIILLLNGFAAVYGTKIAQFAYY